MAYRKFKAEGIFTGYEMLDEDQVLITDREGEVLDIIDTTEAGEGIETFHGILVPGFVNCHCHLELSHLGGYIPERTGLVDFILTIVNERHFDEPRILEAIKNAEDEMLRNGIVAVGDICNNALTLPQKTTNRLRYHNFIEVSGFTPGIAENRFSGSKKILEAYHASPGIHRSTLSPHAPYSVSPELFRMINDKPGNDLITIHNQETVAENELFRNGRGDFLRLYEKMGIDISFFKPGGKSSLQTWMPYFNKKQSLLLVHNVSTSAEDLEFVNTMMGGSHWPTNNHKSQIFFCLCVNANLYISNSLPDIGMFMKHHCNMVLGTDSLASNHQLSIWEEIRSIQKHFPSIELPTLLQWATINGARALQLDHELGSFEKGKRPGVVLINAGNPAAGISRII